MWWLRSSARLHATGRLLGLAGQLERWRRRRRRRARQPACGRGAHVLHIARRRRRARNVFAASRAAALARSWRRGPAGQPAVHRRRRTQRCRGPRHVPLHRHVRGRRHVARPPRALRLRAPAHPPRRRREAVRQRRGRRRAEPLRRRYAERARRREALAGGARVLLAHGARSAGPAAARAPSQPQRHSVSHAARPLALSLTRRSASSRGLQRGPDVRIHSASAMTRSIAARCGLSERPRIFARVASFVPVCLSWFCFGLRGWGEAKVRPQPRWLLSSCPRVARLRVWHCAMFVFTRSVYRIGPGALRRAASAGRGAGVRELVARRSRREQARGPPSGRSGAECAGPRRRQTAARIDAPRAATAPPARRSLHYGPIKTLDCETAVAKPTFIFTLL